MTLRLVGGATRIEEVLQLYEFEAPPVKRGSNAGSRKEGNRFKVRMLELLTPQDASHQIVIVTTTGKSTDGRKIDGNVALERQSYKMLRFKLNPFMCDHLLVVALNSSFAKYENPQLVEIIAHAAWLNALDARAQIRVLAYPRDYREYCGYVFSHEE